ncbi:OmpA family protein [Simiduia sp. 21SJ11W-1]|uniref:OmpA family protein n=1 Tax=Simiduia sp. 21SJ11W-1 TaxID=2909669 RepID=UPI0020A1E528|nr:OmpA family protein [Simiduia sp. 21SJ11W-1]UTA48517.1 OmpA family protein [Simiduia sp. 21SJ11W-1]
MNKHLLSTGIATALVALLATGCATTETPNELQALQEREARLAQDDQVALYAGDAFNEASESVKSATKAWEEDEESLAEHHMYVSDKLLLNTEARTRLGKMEAEFSKADERRAQLELKAKNEALAHKQKEIDKLKAELSEAGSRQSQKANVLTLGDMLFAFDDDQLQPGSQAAIKRLAEFLKKYPDVKIVVEGYTDAQGSEEYNLTLSERRANAVQKALAERGIGKDRINTEGYGEANPVATNSTAAGRQHNRRVEVVVLDKGENYEAPVSTEQVSQRQ